MSINITLQNVAFVGNIWKNKNGESQCFRVLAFDGKLFACFFFIFGVSILRFLFTKLSEYQWELIN